MMENEIEMDGPFVECPKCRALVDAENRKCPECGECLTCQ